MCVPQGYSRQIFLYLLFSVLTAFAFLYIKSLFHFSSIKINLEKDSSEIEIIPVKTEDELMMDKFVEILTKMKGTKNEELIKELEPKVWARRKQSHRQAFGTAPVDEILKYIKDDLPKITEKAGVGPILSKWDKEALAKHKSAEQVDVTMLLVEAFKPKEKSLKWAIEIQKHPPVPAKELEEHMSKHGH